MSNVDKFQNFIETKVNHLPMISVKENCFRIGIYHCLEKYGNWRVYVDSKCCQEFTLRNSALAWCISKMQRQISQADMIMFYDVQYLKHINDSYLFKQSFKQSKDKHHKNLMILRYEESEYQKDNIKSMLKEIIKNIKIR